jgi:hypothetical protein
VAHHDSDERVTQRTFPAGGGGTVNESSDAAEREPVPDDDRLLARLGALFRAIDPPPVEALELARQSFALRTLDAELAALVEDSDLVPAGVEVRGRSEPEPRQLTFQFYDAQNDDELVIAMEVRIRGRRRRLSGHLASRRPAQIEVRQPAVPEPRPVDVDHLGRFVIDDVLPGPVSLTCRRTGARPVATEWTLL